MKKVIILENYNSKYFPINAKWNFYGTKNNMVFASINEAKTFLECLFYDIKFVDRTNIKVV